MISPSKAKVSAVPQQSSVQLYGEQISSCGYCKLGKDDEQIHTSRSYGIVATKMLVEDYEKLMLMGWRRSGTYFYKPTMYETCCPQYTIRLQADKFTPSKSQKLVLRRMEKFLATGDIKSVPGNDDVISDVHVPVAAAETIVVNGCDMATDSIAASGIDLVTNTKSMSEGIPVRTSHSLTVETVKPEFTQERFELYKKYQQRVHGDNIEELTEAGFTRFLVTSPLALKVKRNVRTDASVSASISQLPQSNQQGEPGLQYGTFHQLYRLDGNLVAVGVIDIVPTGVSSVYMFYDPDQRHLVLGKYTALRELEYCKSLGLTYYYMGFYIHSCVKMRYKGEYRPSELLCPTSLQWYPLAKVTELLERFRFTPFHPALAAFRATILPEETPAIAANPLVDSSTGESLVAAVENSVDPQGRAVDPIDTISTDALSVARIDPRLRVFKPLCDITPPELDSLSAEFNSSVSVWLDTINSKFERAVRIMVNGVPLNIGAGQLVQCWQLTSEGKQIVEPLVQEWLEHCGTRIGSDIIVKLC